jgi:hypothetical protein
LQTTKLLEELRIYQVELELQNEELRDAQQEAELARKRYQTLFAQMPLAALVWWMTKAQWTIATPRRRPCLVRANVLSARTPVCGKS